MRKRVALGLRGNSICTLDYAEFDWETFKRELAKQGIEVTRDEAIPCG